MSYSAIVRSTLFVSKLAYRWTWMMQAIGITCGLLESRTGRAAHANGRKHGNVHLDGSLRFWGHVPCYRRVSGLASDHEHLRDLEDTASRADPWSNSCLFTGGVSFH